MGSPDPTKQQLNGMGGGIPALSKVCVVSTSTRSDADVDFEFVQVVVGDGSLDLASNCGNMIAAVGPFAFDKGLYSPSPAQLQADPEHVTVRIYNTNTDAIIVSTFPISGKTSRFQATGNYKMNGVPGAGSKIALSFVSPGGSATGKILPAGSETTTLDTKDISGKNVQVSLVDIANPGVFVDGRSLGLDPEVTPAMLGQQSDAMTLLERIRQESAEKMGLDPNVASVPKILALFPSSADAIAAGVNIGCIALSMGAPHPGIPLTLALNLGAACRMKGTVASALASQLRDGGDVSIQYPSGTIVVGVDIEGSDVRSASLYSTARMLMQGEVNVD